MSLTPGHLKDLVWSFTAHFSRSQEEDPAPSLAATSVPASALGWGGMGSSSPFLSSTWSHSRHQVEMVDKKTRLWGWKTTAPGAWGRADNEVPTECVSCVGVASLSGSGWTWVPDPACSCRPPAGPLARAGCESADVLRPASAWPGLRRASAPRGSTPFARAVIFLPPKPRCWLCLLSNAKNTEPLPGNESPHSLT